jgi:hypothetical protein
MFTRAFLILLAMMTGLSAAQAAESVRPAQNTVDVRAAYVRQQTQSLLTAAKRQVSTHAMALAASPVGLASTDDAADRVLRLPHLRCTFLSDRARE